MSHPCDYGMCSVNCSDWETCLLPQEEPVSTRIVFAVSSAGEEGEVICRERGTGMLLPHVKEESRHDLSV